MDKGTLIGDLSEAGRVKIGGAMRATTGTTLRRPLRKGVSAISAYDFPTILFRHCGR